jgi:hypothetical protein
VYKSSLVIIILATLTGCSSLYEPSPGISTVGNNFLVSSTAALTHTLIKPENDKSISCSYPAPDTLFQQSESASFNILNFGGGASPVQEGEKSGGQEMVGRTSGVLLSRELMFRLCEFSSNFNLEVQDALSLYDKTLEVIHDVTLEEMKNTQVSISETTSLTESSVSGSAPVLAPLPAPSNSPATDSEVPASMDSTLTCDSDGYYVGTDTLCSS